MRHATALVQLGPGEVESQTFDLPELVPGSALLRVEACGLCGSDVDYFRGEQVIGASLYPRILGHEVVGVIEALGADTSNRPGLAVGSRVALDPILSCGTCRMCVVDANRMFCRGFPFKPAFYGTIPTSIAPSLWGGYATHVYVDPRAVLYPVPDNVDALTASLWNALAAGIQWGVTVPGTAVGTSLLVLGAGQRGLATVIAARSAGASFVAVTGLSRDRHKMELALELGADLAIDVEVDDPLSRIALATGGYGVDVVVDTTSRSIRPVVDAVEVVRPGGTIILYGIKNTPLDGFPIDAAIYKGLTIQCATGLTADSFQRALDLLGRAEWPFDKLRTHVFPMADLERALSVLSGETDETAVNVVLTPDWG